MATTEPIKDRTQLKEFLDFYLEIHPNRRNYALVTLGVNSALRISDILRLTWGEVYDFHHERFRMHLRIEEAKTGKQNVIALNERVRLALADYKRERHVSPSDYIFSKRTSPQVPISRIQAYRIIRKITDYHHANNISCHSMRKTFGYHAWKQGTPPVLLMDVYNHSSFQVTKRYLGINQDEKDILYLEIDI